MNIGDRVKVIENNTAGIPINATGYIQYKFGRVYYVTFEIKKKKVDGYIFETRLKKIRDKYMTLKQADKLARMEIQAYISTESLVKEFCDKLKEDTK